jgi:peroxiredoxin
MSNDRRAAPVAAGDPAPHFALPAAHQDGTVSLADYRDRSPVLVALLRGLYCHFCRLHVVHLGTMASSLEKMGVRTVGVLATEPERARLYFRFRPPAMPVAADPELVTHQAFGLPNLGPPTPEAYAVANGAAARELGLSGPVEGALERLGGHDGYTLTPDDAADFGRHQVQLTGQFLIDSTGVVRWANVECAREGVAGFGKLPPESEVLAAARAL